MPVFPAKATTSPFFAGMRSLPDHCRSHFASSAFSMAAKTRFETGPGKPQRWAKR